MRWYKGAKDEDNTRKRLEAEPLCAKTPTEKIFGARGAQKWFTEPSVQKEEYKTLYSSQPAMCLFSCQRFIKVEKFLHCIEHLLEKKKNEKYK